METKETKDTEINTKDIGWTPRISDGNQCYWMKQGYEIETNDIG